MDSTPVTIELHSKQLETLNKLLAFRGVDMVLSLLFGGGARGGKSWLGAIVLFILAMRYPRVKLFIARRELKDVKLSVLEGTWKKVSRKYGWDALWSYNDKYSVISFVNGSTVQLIGLQYMPSDPDFNWLGSYEFTAGWVEEGQETHSKAYEILRTRVGQHLNTEYGISPFLFITCNPHKGWLKRMFYDPWKNGAEAKGRVFIQSLYTDNPYREASTDSTLDGIEDAAQRSRLRDGDWNYSDDPRSILTHDMIDYIQTTPAINGPMKLAADVSRFGDDTTNIYMGRGNQINKALTWSKANTVETATRIKALMQMHNIAPANVIIDVVGLGAGVVDTLRETFKLNVQSFNGGMKPTKTRTDAQGRTSKTVAQYRNLRTQSYFELRRLAEEGAISLKLSPEEIDILAEELTATKYDYTDKEIFLIKKEIIKKDLGRSPDKSDTMAMFYHLDAAPQRPRISFAAA